MLKVRGSAFNAPGNTQMKPIRDETHTQVGQERNTRGFRSLGETQAN